ncbi:hypothetical protein OP862_02275 [Yersinia massiliensis]|uniref:hypothetical protein n=1 Tax=Yersinia massiliensis TaxID=419257 RepID=UPI0022407BD4|nr:hypothetical protein [Yersinia massiliensis]MDA5548598.1 hypothetical protein [Yersinia massiliensis]UZM79536.1 hypothetical protein OP862_02275 [Yersinia massiliensis]
MTHNRSIKNDITLVTIISIVSYGMVYFFQSGVARYFGYPTDFINIDLTMLIKTIFAFFGVLVFSLSLLDIHFSMVRLKIVHNLFIFFMFFWIFSLLVVGSFSPLASFYSGYMALPSYLALASISLVSSLAFLANLSKTNFSDFNYKSFMIAIVLIISTPYSFGWLSAYKTKDIFVSDDLYLLNSYGTFLVLGKCSDGKSSFILTEGSQNLKFIKSDNADFNKLKKCFELASKIQA